MEVVGCADDEHTAVDWLSRSGHEARLVIVDIFLKSGSGLGVLQAAAAASGDERKWVVFSNYATDNMRNRCLALGADRVFDKSTEIDALIDYCEQLSTGASTRPGALG